MKDIVTNVTLPVIGNIDEAKDWQNEFSAIITAGPLASEVNWNHPQHLVVEFGDTTVGNRAPTYEQVKRMIDWGVDKDDLLVHCHAGMSRSTSTAWGISIARGIDPEDSFITLRDEQPVEQYWGRNSKRDFIPNRLIVKHLEKMFKLDLLSILYVHRHENL
jgi:predicted protein tyrosine phosphatase